MLTRFIIAATALALAAPCLAGTKTRTSRFEYDAQGQLIREIIEPDDSTLCLVTTYILDPHGNRLSATTRNCNGTNSNGVIEAAPPAGDPVFTPRTSGATYAAGSDVNGAWIDGQFPTTITNALNQSETDTYDPRFGGILTLTGPNNLQTIWRYDNFGRKQSETRADGTASTWFYERCADLAGACPSGAQYRVRVTATGAPTASTYYNNFNREVRTETQGFDGTLVLKDTQYDSFGRVAFVMGPYYTGATPQVRTFVYDILGRVTQTLDPQTPSGRAVALTAYNTVVTATTWTTTVTMTNGYGSTNMPGGVTQTKSTTKNSQGQAVQVKDTQNNTLSYTYDEFGNLNTTTDALGNVTALTNDLRGRKIQMIDPDMGTWTYSYDSASDLVRQTDAKGQVVTMLYDPLARMTIRTELDLTSKWFYDNYPTTAPEWNASLVAGLTGSCANGTGGTGKLCYASVDNGYRRLLTYDGLGRPKELNALIDTAYLVTTSYVTTGIHIGKIDTVTYPRGTDPTGFGVRQVYNGFGYLSEVRVANPSANPAFAADNTLLWHENAQSASGKVTSELLGGNAGSLTQTRTFDPVDRLSSVVASGTGGTVHNLTYQYDPIGNVTQRVDNVDGVTENFAYDTLSRLLSASGPGLITRSFNYDAIGNMIYKSDVGSGTYTYPASGAGSVRPHAVSSIAGTVNGIANPTLSYDPNGNLTSSLGRTLTYMSFNLPLTISGSAAIDTYTYSPEHERVKLITQLATGTQTTIYLHPGGPGTLLYEKEILPDHTENKHYVNAGAQLIGVYVTKSVYVGSDGPQMRYYHSDGVGSIVAISNEAGAPLERLAYEAFGKRRFPNGTADPNNTLFGITTDRGFTAQEHLDELGLIHMNGRIYDPLLARFMTPDPTVPYQFNPQSFNRYSYALNNPLRFIDPSGFCSEEDGWSFCDIPGEAGGVGRVGNQSNSSSLLNDLLSQMMTNEWLADMAKLTAAAVSAVSPTSWDPTGNNSSSSFIPKFPVVPPVQPDIQGNDPSKGGKQFADAGAQAAAAPSESRLRNMAAHAAATGGCISTGGGLDICAGAGAIRAVGASIATGIARSLGFGSEIVGESRALVPYYPPNQGFAGASTRTTLLPGTIVDRFGGTGGSFLSPQGTPAFARSLQYGAETRPLNAYEVVKPIQVEAGRAASWFGQLGTGIQYDLGTRTVQDLINSGYLRPLQ